MGIFSGCKFTVEFDATVRFKEKQNIRKAVTDNDGVISYTINKKVTCLFFFNFFYKNLNELSAV